MGRGSPLPDDLERLLDRIVATREDRCFSDWRSGLMPYAKIWGDAAEETNPFRHTVGLKNKANTNGGLPRREAAQWLRSVIFFTNNCRQSRS